MRNLTRALDAVNPERTYRNRVQSVFLLQYFYLSAAMIGPSGHHLAMILVPSCYIRAKPSDAVWPHSRTIRVANSASSGPRVGETRFQSKPAIKSRGPKTHHFGCSPTRWPNSWSDATPCATANPSR